MEGTNLFSQDIGRCNFFTDIINAHVCSDSNKDGDRDIYETYSGIQRQRRCGTATEDMWDDEYGKMGCKDGDGLGKY